MWAQNFKEYYALRLERAISKPPGASHSKQIITVANAECILLQMYMLNFGRILIYLRGFWERLNSLRDLILVQVFAQVIIVGLGGMCVISYHA